MRKRIGMKRHPVTVGPEPRAVTWLSSDHRAFRHAEHRESVRVCRTVLCIAVAKSFRLNGLCFGQAAEGPLNEDLTVLRHSK